MANEQKSLDDLNRLGKEMMEQAKGSTEQYVAWMQKNTSGLPWGNTDLILKMMAFAQQNIAASFRFVQEVSMAKDFQDLFRIQTEFMKAQLDAFGKQAVDLTEASNKAMTEVSKGFGDKAS